MINIYAKQEHISRKYISVLQQQAMLAGTQNLVVEIGRGGGKTTHIFAPRLVEISYSMPQSIMLLVAPTYTFVLDTIVPNIVSYLAEHYTRGIHYEYGKRPPSFFKSPLTEVNNWKHTFSFAWGTVVQFASIDRPESMVGKNAVHVFVDETLRIKEDAFIERVYPALRGNREVFGGSPYFGGMTLTSSTPNMENDHDWWLTLEKNVNQTALDEIMYAQFRILEAEGRMTELMQELLEFEKTGNILRIATLKKGMEYFQRFIDRHSEQLLQARLTDDKVLACKWAYIKGSSFSNLAILSLDYMRRQLAAARNNPDMFKLSILGIRPEKVKEMFFARFGKHNIYTDSYEYGSNFDKETVAGEFIRSASQLKHYNPKRPIQMGFDPGNFMSAAIGQEKIKENEFRILKNFYVITPEQHYELAENINTFFGCAERKVIEIWADRAANQRKEIYSKNTKGKTDIAILKRCLEDFGWRVDFMNPDQRTIEYWEHYMLNDILMGERHKNVPKVLACQYECEELISAIYHSPLKRTNGSWIELDKSSEVKLPYSEQAFYSTQIPSALMYLLWGLYGNQYKPQAQSESSYVPAL